MISLAIALVVLLGAGATVAASDSARPGDALFSIDRMSEDVRLKMTTDVDAKAELRGRITEERIEEIESIIEEEREEGATTTSSFSSEGKVRVQNALSVLNGFLIEARTQASSTANARAVLQRVEARLDAMDDRLPSDMRVGGGNQSNTNSNSNANVNGGGAKVNTNANINSNANTNASTSNGSTGGGASGNAGVNLDVSGKVKVY